jgi:hypothetical protein
MFFVDVFRWFVFLGHDGGWAAMLNSLQRQKERERRGLDFLTLVFLSLCSSLWVERSCAKVGRGSAVVLGRRSGTE